jgi:RNA polymerase-binding transcription factor DksA
MPPGLADSTIENLRTLLLERRAGVAHASASFHEEATEAIETADVSDILDEDDPDTTDAEESLMLAVSADEHLASIDLALERIEAGTYGFCQQCRRRIPMERLRAIPETPFCVECSSHQRT